MRTEATLVPPALRELASTELAAEEAEAAARRAGLDTSRPHLVVVAETSADDDHAPDALAEIAVRVLRASGVNTRAMVIDGRTTIVAEASATLTGFLSVCVEEARSETFEVRLGVGGAGHVAHLPTSRKEALDALAVASVAELGPIIHFEDLGAWHLLTMIPVDAMLKSSDVRAVRALPCVENGVSDLEILRHFCGSGSLRGTASRVYLHHSSVSYRLRKIETAIGIDLSEPSGRARASLAVRLVLLSQRLADVSGNDSSNGATTTR